MAFLLKTYTQPIDAIITTGQLGLLIQKISLAPVEAICPALHSPQRGRLF